MIHSYDMIVIRLVQAYDYYSSCYRPYKIVDGDIDEIKFDSPIKTNGIYLQLELPNSSYYTIYELKAYGK